MCSDAPPEDKQMSSWQRRKAAVDRRFSFHATITEQTADGSLPPSEPGDDRPAETGTAGPVEPVTVSLVPAPPTPSAAARLAAMLREDQLAARHDRVVLAGTA
jgi:hypothetical protein